MTGHNLDQEGFSIAKSKVKLKIVVQECKTQSITTHHQLTDRQTPYTKSIARQECEYAWQPCQHTILVTHKNKWVDGNDFYFCK